MKMIALATALALGGTAFAQDTTTTTTTNSTTMSTTTPPSTSPMMPQDTVTPPNSDMSAPMPVPPNTTTAVPTTQNQPMGATMNQPAPVESSGGYMPSTPALSGPATAGATIRFQPSMSPDQAYPAPAPEAEYPVCQAGQYDNCRQRGE